MGKRNNPAPLILEQHLFYLFGQALGRRDRMLQQALKPLGMAVDQWRILAALRAREGCSMTALAETTAIDRTTLTRSVARMRAKKLVERKRDEIDRRATRLRLSARGRALYERALPIALRQNELAVAGMSAGEITAFRAQLWRIINNLVTSES
jgi:DNA-binding MarR family transcriptional regulator